MQSLIRRLAAENSEWGAPKIQYFATAPATQGSWQELASLPGNHHEAIVAMDCFAAPILIFKLLYGFFVIEHTRRRILHFNITRYPSADRVVQQWREAEHWVGGRFSTISSHSIRNISGGHGGLRLGGLHHRYNWQEAA